MASGDPSVLVVKQGLAEKELSKVSLPSKLALHHALLLQGVEHL